MQKPRTRNYRRLVATVLLVALVLATVLRFVGLGFGRGVLTPRADEELLRSGVLITLTGDLNPHYAVWGHLFHYIYSAVVAAWIAFRVWAGLAPSWTDALAAAHCEPWTFIRLGRAISATAGVLTLVATYQLARRCVGSRLVAVCSCILLSTLFLHVRDSHFATSDVMLALFSTAALAAMAQSGRPKMGWAGLWTGLSLATKLLSATLVLTFLTMLVLHRDRGEVADTRSQRLWLGARFLALVAGVALVTQPFLLLDPMETWFGLFGDLFNSERRPLEHGLSLTNASIIVRYYVPQAIGWPIGGLAVLGGLILIRRLLNPRVGPLIVYVGWSLLAVLSVQRIFLRYLDPLLPVACVLAAHAIVAIVRRFVKWRLAVTLIACVALATPNLVRDFWLDCRLLQDDTRALAGRWIEQNVPAGSRVLWSGYGSIAPHLTMPWLHATDEYDRQHIAARSARELPTAVDEAIRDWKRAHSAPTYWVVRLDFGVDRPPQSGLQTYPFLDHRYDRPVLSRIDRWSRDLGLLRRESPRWEWMRRHVAEKIETTPEALMERHEEFVVLTGMPCDPAIVERLEEAYVEEQTFEPGVPWTEYRGRVMYDLGDAWYLPNWGIDRVARPGPEIRIFKLKSAAPRPPDDDPSPGPARKD